MILIRIVFMVFTNQQTSPGGPTLYIWASPHWQSQRTGKQNSAAVPVVPVVPQADAGVLLVGTYYNFNLLYGWENYNSSLSWKVRQSWGWFPYKNPWLEWGKTMKSLQLTQIWGERDIYILDIWGYLYIYIYIGFMLDHPIRTSY